MARPRLITDEQILTTMRSCVLEHGAQVSLDVVAQQLGVTSPALLKRFGSLEALMLEALRPPEDPAFIAGFLASEVYPVDGVSRALGVAVRCLLN